VEKATGRAAGEFHRLLPGGHAAWSHAGIFIPEEQIDRVRSATFFVSLLDFSAPGELGVFIDEGQVANLERR
jgi:polyhydroxyalkanoate synthase